MFVRGWPLLGELHAALAEVLREQPRRARQGGEVNAFLLNVVRQFLKDNGIEASADNEGIAGVQEALRLVDDLPFADDSGSAGF